MVGVTDTVSDGVTELVGVTVFVGVTLLVGVTEFVGVFVIVGVTVGVGVFVGVVVGVDVGVGVGLIPHTKKSKTTPLKFIVSRFVRVILVIPSPFDELISDTPLCTIGFPVVGEIAGTAFILI